MTLAEATDPQGVPVGPRGRGPFRTDDLRAIAAVDFVLPCGDAWILRDGTPGHAYLEGARAAWASTPEWMDFLAPDAPGHVHKGLERDLYLHLWRDWLGGERILDVGCSVGRFVAPFLDRGADVWGVDADPEALRRCLRHAIGRPGRLDLAWTTATALPD